MMKQKVICLLLVFLLSLLLVPVSSASIGNGKEIYVEECGSCHGPLGDYKEVIGVDFSSSEYWNDVSDEEVIEAVRYGVGNMPSFSFSEKEYSDLLNYLHQLESDENSRELIILAQIIGFGSLFSLVVFSKKQLFDFALSFASMSFLVAAAVFGFLSIYNLTIYFYFSAAIAVLSIIYFVLSNKIALKNFEFVSFIRNIELFLLGISLLIGFLFIV